MCRVNLTAQCFGNFSQVGQSSNEKMICNLLSDWLNNELKSISVLCHESFKAQRAIIILLVYQVNLYRRYLSRTRQNSTDFFFADCYQMDGEISWREFKAFYFFVLSFRAQNANLSLGAIQDNLSCSFQVTLFQKRKTVEYGATCTRNNTLIYP